MMTDQEYWDKAAADPDVENKYICDIDADECLAVIVPALKEAVKTGYDDILDVGCGIGRLSARLAIGQFAGTTVYGIDVSPEMLAIAQSRIPNKLYNLRYKLCDGYTIPFKDNSFAAVYSMLMFQHIDDQNMLDYIYEVSRVLKNHRAFRFQFVQGHHHAPLDHNHDIADVKRWLDNAGFKIKDIETGIIFPQWTWVTAVKRGKT